jgi:hypothetical protein
MAVCNILQQAGERLKFQVSAWHVAGGTIIRLAQNTFFDWKLFNYSI